MEQIMYVATVDGAGIVHVLRQMQSPVFARDSITPFPMTLDPATPESAVQLAWLLLFDCLRHDGRADRLQHHLAHLLIKPLLSRSDWMLTNDDIELAVGAIEALEGWFWLDEGYYADQDPRLQPETIH